MSNDLSRRDFLKGVAAGATVLATGNLIGCTSNPPTDPAPPVNAEPATPPVVEDVKPTWIPDKWDGEADLVVVGYGAAGATAAIAAAYEGASVIVLEKSPEADGGNLGCASGSVHTCPGANLDDWFATFKHGAYGTVPDDIIKGALAKTVDTPEWMEKYGVPMRWTDTQGTGRQRPASPYKNGYVDGYDGRDGRFLFAELHKAAVGFGADIRLGTPGKELIQNPLTKEILGVVAEETSSGQKLNFKAKKGVILAMGGYANNIWISSNYNYPGLRFYPWGTPYNTGDGFPMVMAVGAELWHMHALEIATLCFKTPSDIANCSISTDASIGIQPYNHLIVDYKGKRFMKEDGFSAHNMKHQPAFDFDDVECDYKHLPCFLVFDQPMFDAGPLWKGTGRSGIINTFAGVYNHNHPDAPLLDWGPDNNGALEKGWIFKGETIEELAANIKGARPCGTESESINGIDGAALKESIATFNKYAKNGVDPEFNRDGEHMAPLTAGPYYAIELGFSSINTQGGPMRNEECQTLDVKRTPIPRLYNAGEFGSYNGYVYGYGNIFEGLTTGRVAAHHALTLSDWE